MSWNVLLERTMPPRFTGRSQAAKPHLCLRWLPAAKITPKMLPLAAGNWKNMPRRHGRLLKRQRCGSQLPLLSPRSVTIVRAVVTIFRRDSVAIG